MRHINIVIRHLWCVLTVTILIWENVDLRFGQKKYLFISDRSKLREFKNCSQLLCL